MNEAHDWPDNWRLNRAGFTGRARKGSLNAERQQSDQWRVQAKIMIAIFEQFALQK